MRCPAEARRKQADAGLDHKRFGDDFHALAGCGAQREDAQPRGYTVVDAPTVIATHISKVLQENAHGQFRHQEAQFMLDRLAKQTPKLAKELVPKTLPLSVVVRLLPEELPVITLEPRLEQILQEALRGGAESSIEPTLAEPVQAQLSNWLVKTAVELINRREDVSDDFLAENFAEVQINACA